MGWGGDGRINGFETAVHLGGKSCCLLGGPQKRMALEVVEGNAPVWPIETVGLPTLVGSF